MDETTFRHLALSEWEAMPEKFKTKVKNVALIVEDEPGGEVRKTEGLHDGQTLLGLYHGIPNTERGSEYGVGTTLPDTITLYRIPLLMEAQMLMHNKNVSYEDAARLAIKETIWHEVGHYFGFDEEHIHHREDEGTNKFEL